MRTASETSFPPLFDWRDGGALDADQVWAALCEVGACQLLLPAAQVGRESDAYLFSATSTHRVAPGGYWLAVASAKVEGATDGLNAMQVAKRELKAALPLLKPARKLFAEMTTVSEASDGLPAGLHVLSTGGAESHLLTTADDVRKMYEEITGEPLDELIDDY